MIAAVNEPIKEPDHDHENENLVDPMNDEEEFMHH